MYIETGVFKFGNQDQCFHKLAVMIRAASISEFTRKDCTKLICYRA